MGVKFAREYEDIVKDLIEGINQIDGVHEFFGMGHDDWKGLGDEEKKECIRTVSDDVFYALGADRSINVGHGLVSYDEGNHIIKVHNGDKCVFIVKLI